MSHGATHVFPLAGAIDPLCSLACGKRRSDIDKERHMKLPHKVDRIDDNSDIREHYAHERDAGPYMTLCGRPIGNHQAPAGNRECRVCAKIFATKYDPNRIIKLGLGDSVQCTANLDDGPAATEIAKCETGRGWIKGTREQLIAVLYYIDGCPAMQGGASDFNFSAIGAVKRTVRSWRAKLGVHGAIPVPESARH